MMIAGIRFTATRAAPRAQRVQPLHSGLKLPAKPAENNNKNENKSNNNKERIRRSGGGGTRREEKRRGVTKVSGIER